MPLYSNDQGQPGGAIPVYITSGGGSGPPPGKPVGYQQIPATAAVATLTVPTGATRAYINGSTAYRWRADGTAPTATVGSPVPANTPTLFSGASLLAALQMIAQSGTTVYDITYYA